ncbi:Rhodanese-like protein, partial [Rhizoclosmatium globosum]
MSTPTAAKPLDRETLAGWIQDQRKDFLVVDVRGNSDFAEGHVKGAENIPVDQIEQDAKAFESRLTSPKKLVFHCQLSQGVGAAEGQEVYVLQGGFTGWEEKFGKDALFTEEKKRED